MTHDPSNDLASHFCSHFPTERMTHVSGLQAPGAKSSHSCCAHGDLNSYWQPQGTAHRLCRKAHILHRKKPAETQEVPLALLAWRKNRATLLKNNPTKPQFPQP